VKPRRSSLTSGLLESTVTLDDALKLLSLPRELGIHPESGQPVVAGLGRYGPYIKHGDDYRSLESEDDLFTVDLAGSLALLAAPKKQGRRQSAAKRVIRQLEATDGGAPLQLLEGRYGPYVTDGTTNASLPRGADPATLTLEDARALIEARAGAPPREGRRPATRSRTRAPRARAKTAADGGEPALKKSAARKGGTRTAAPRKRVSS
jgi:DNA topoisomerase-1